MGETLADITRHDRARANSPKLVVRHTGDGMQHGSKVVIEDLDFFDGQTQALEHVCLTLPEHQVTALIGQSGCGKSTLLHMLNRTYSMYPDQCAIGTLLLDGEGVIGPKVDLNRLRSRVGMVFQEITVFPMSVFENVAFGTDVNDRWHSPSVHAGTSSDDAPHRTTRGRQLDRI